MTSLVKAIQERLAKICEDEWRNAKNDRPEYRQNAISHGCIACAYAIRAADLSDLEPKEGATPRTDAFQKEYDENSLTNGDVEILDFASQLERELAALTARLEAKEAECEALRRDAQRVDWLEEVRPNIYFKVGHVYKKTQAIEIEWSNNHSFIYTDGETLRAAIDAAKDSHE